MKIFGLQIGGKGDARRLQVDRVTAPVSTGFGWNGTKLSPMQVRSMLAGMASGDFATGHELFVEMMDTWHVLAKDLQQLREAVAGVRYSVAPYAVEGDDPTDSAEERADVVRRAMSEFKPDPSTDENGFEDFLYDLTDSLVLGVTVSELLWTRANGLVLPRASVWVHPSQIGMDESGRLGLMRRGNRAVIEPFMTDKFVIGSYKVRSGVRTMGGLLRPLAWWWCSVMYGRDWVLRNAELFGQPIRDIEYDPNIKPEDLAQLQEMAAQMGSSAWITRPAGTKLTLVEPQKTGNAAPQAELLDRANTAADLMILWQTLTSDVADSGSRALGDVHKGVRRERVQNIAAWIGNVLSYQFAPMVCRLNFGDDDECPIIRPDFTEQETAQAKTTRLKEAAAIVPLPKSWTYEQLGVPVPDEDEETIGTAAAPKETEMEDPTKGATKGAMKGAMKGPMEGPMKGAMKDEEDKVRAREMGFVTAFADEKFVETAQNALAVAQANDLAPVRARLRAILSLSDEASQRAAMQDLVSDLPDVLRAINASPATARALEAILGASMVNGMSEGKREVTK